MSASLQIMVSYDEETKSYGLHRRIGETENVNDKEMALIKKLESQLVKIINTELGQGYVHVPETDTAAMLAAPTTVQ